MSLFIATSHNWHDILFKNLQRGFSFYQFSLKPSKPSTYTRVWQGIPHEALEELHAILEWDSGDQHWHWLRVWEWWHWTMTAHSEEDLSWLLGPSRFGKKKEKRKEKHDSSKERKKERKKDLSWHSPNSQPVLKEHQDLTTNNRAAFEGPTQVGLSSEKNGPGKQTRPRTALMLLGASSF